MTNSPSAFLLKLTFITTFRIECKQYFLLSLFWKHNIECAKSRGFFMLRESFVDIIFYIFWEMNKKSSEKILNKY